MGLRDAIMRKLRGVYLPENLLNHQGLGLGDMASDLHFNHNISGLINPALASPGRYTPDFFQDYGRATSAYKRLITHPSFSYTTDFERPTVPGEIPLEQIDLDRLRWRVPETDLKYGETPGGVSYDFGQEPDRPFFLHALNTLYWDPTVAALPKLREMARQWWEGD